MHIKKNKDKIELNKFGGTNTMNIGCDIIKNKRLENKEQRFIDFILTEKEQMVLLDALSKYAFVRPKEGNKKFWYKNNWQWYK